MKKRMIIIAVASALLISCNGREPEIIVPALSGETVELQIWFDEPQTQTRSFFDDVGNFTDRESKINNVRLFLYGADGNHIQTFNVNRSVVNIPYVAIEVPREACGQQCILFAIANYHYGQTAQPTAEAMFRYDNSSFTPTNFNTSVENHLSGNLDYAFMMSGYSEFYLRSYGLKTMAVIQLTRLVSKVAFRYKIDDDFRANHNGGMIRIDRTLLTIMPKNCYVFHRPGIYHPSPTIGPSDAQEPLLIDGYYHHIFYFYELGITSTGVSQTRIAMQGTYDYDGDFSTDDDQTEFMLDVPINPDGNGITERNTYYKIDGVIMGIGKQNLDLTFSIKDWNEVDNNIII